MESDARAHNFDSLTYLAPPAQLNYLRRNNYATELEAVAQLTGQVVVNASKRTRPGFARGRGSRFRGVVRVGDTGKWQAVIGNCDKHGSFLILGIFDTEVEAAISFDIACIKQKGYLAVTNFDMRCYDVEALMLSPNKLPKPQGIFKPETRRMVTPQKQAYPDLNINTGTFGYETITKPKIRFLGQAAGFPRNFLEILGLNEQDNAPASSCFFQHGDFSPFEAFQGIQHMKEEKVCSFGLGHSTSSASETACKRRKTSYSTNALRQLIAHDLWSLPPLSINFERERWLKAQGLGFRHSSTSCFKVYNEAMMHSKGKGKVIF